MIKSKKLSKIKNLKHGFFNNMGGHSKDIYKSLNCGPGSNDKQSNIKKNLQKVRKKISTKAKNIFLVSQFHSNKFVYMDVPAGVVNLLTGAHSELAAPLASHLNIDAIWSFSSSDLSTEIETQSALGLKRSWVNYGQDRDWFSTDGEGKSFLAEASQSKTVWIPFGEG